MKNSRGIKEKIVGVVMGGSVIIAFIICSALLLYVYFDFRETTLAKLSMYGEIISTNSTTALASENKEYVAEVLGALKAEPSIIAASIYDSKGRLFGKYPATVQSNLFPSKPRNKGYTFTTTQVESFQPVIQGNRLLGTLYLKSDVRDLYSRFHFVILIFGLILLFLFVLAILFSKFLQNSILKPVLVLSATARSITYQNNYSLRAEKISGDEVGDLTDAINELLTQVQLQTERLNEINRDLEETVHNRTLEQEAANKELESFSYSVSHDLRAPVRAIHSYLTIFLDQYGEKLDEEGKRLLMIVSLNGKKMGALIDDLLRFSQLGRKELIKLNISMHELVLSICNDVKNAEARQNINFKISKIPNAYAENSTIQQVWINLVSNAVKYSKNKKETVIEIGSETKGDDIIYYIKDNGSGFDMKYYNKLFAVFQRLHSSDEFEGTGMGLAIAERIIKKHGGKIWAEGKVNKGATFYFSLPLKGEG